MNPLFDMQDVSVDVPLAGDLWSALMPGDGRRLNILDGITLAIGRGETLGIVGESGSGKTTLARAMLGLVPLSAGTMRFEGRTLDTAAAFVGLRRSTALMFQNPVASLSPRMKIGTLLAEPFTIHRIPLPDRRAKVRELLDLLGLPGGIADRYPHELSGGQARRVCLARALALDPKLVVADEPTAGLDVSVQGEVLNLMAGFRERLGLSFLVISHNLAMVRHVTDRMAIMYLGRIVETGPTQAIFDAPRHPYTASLILSEPQPDPRKRRDDLAFTGDIPSLLRRPEGCEFHTRCLRAAPRCRTVLPTFENANANWRFRCHYPLDPTPKTQIANKEMTT